MAARARPRPRFAQKKTELDVPSTSAAPSFAGPSAPIVMRSVVQNEDDFFSMRNKPRGNAWKSIDRSVPKVQSTQLTEDSDSEDNDEDTIAIQHRRPRNSHKSSKTKTVPDWEKKMEALQNEDDNDSDEPEIIETTPRPGRPNDAHRRNKRNRSRSRSITPPPEIPREKIEVARNLTYRVLGEARPVSPTNDGDEDDDELPDLNPELQRIVYDVKRQATSISPGIETPISARPVKIIVKWIPHPEDRTGQTSIRTYTLNGGDSFSSVFNATVDELAVYADDVVFTYDGKRVFPLSTPQTLNIWGEAELEACTKRTHEYIRTRRYQPAATEPMGGAMDPTTDDKAYVSDAESIHSQDGDGAAKDTFKLIIRSSATKNISVTVRPTTKCGSIVATFLKRTGIKPKYPKKVKLLIDGDSMDPDTALEDADLEDGDVVDITGL